MNSIMENIKLPGANSDLNSLKEKLNRKFDVILAAGTVLEMSGECTQLQSAIGELLLTPTHTFAGKRQIGGILSFSISHFLTYCSLLSNQTSGHLIGCSVRKSPRFLRENISFSVQRIVLQRTFNQAAHHFSQRR